MTLQNNKDQIKIAILASGNGSNAEALIKKAKDLNNPIALVITDNQQAGIIDRCQRLKVPCYKILMKKDEAKSYQEAKIKHEQNILALLKENKIQWIFLAGYMRILSPDFLNKFYNKFTHQSNIINIHPSMLPAFPGKKAYYDAYTSDIQSSGITVHFVDSGIDTGKIICQKAFTKKPQDNFDSFKNRGLELEHIIYPKVLESLIKDPKSFPKGHYEIN